MFKSSPAEKQLLNWNVNWKEPQKKASSQFPLHFPDAEPTSKLIIQKDFIPCCFQYFPIAPPHRLKAEAAEMAGQEKPSRSSIARNMQQFLIHMAKKCQTAKIRQKHKSATSENNSTPKTAKAPNYKLRNQKQPKICFYNFATIRERSWQIMIALPRTKSAPCPPILIKDLPAS